MSESNHIRIGFFKKLKGEDSILISVDIKGLLEMEAVFKNLSKGKKEFDFSQLKLIDSNYKIPIKALNTDSDIGINKLPNDTYEWKLSSSKWNELREILTSMYKNGEKGHHYFDIGTEDLQVIFSWNEYPIDFWIKHFN